MQTLIDSWSDRLGHEHRNLAAKLNADKDTLIKAALLVDGQDLKVWKEIICDDMVERKVQKQRHGLMARIEAMRSKG